MRVSPHLNSRSTIRVLSLKPFHEFTDLLSGLARKTREVTLGLQPSFVTRQSLVDPQAAAVKKREQRFIAGVDPVVFGQVGQEFKGLGFLKRFWEFMWQFWRAQGADRGVVAAGVPIGGGG